ncbi:hypothetical protein HK104_001928, partial [Borealophlyctis nickersoniae]
MPSMVAGESIKEEDIIDVTSGDFHNLALSHSGKVYTWGGGLLGNSSELFDSNPLPLPFFTDIGRRAISVAARGEASAVTAVSSSSTSDGPVELYAFGYLPTRSGTFVKAQSPVLLVEALGQPMMQARGNVEAIACGTGGCIGIAGVQDGQRICIVFGSGSATPRNPPDHPRLRDVARVTDVWDEKPSVIVQVGENLSESIQALALGQDFGLVLQGGQLHHFDIPSPASAAQTAITTTTLANPSTQIISVDVGPWHAAAASATGDIYLCSSSNAPTIGEAAAYVGGHEGGW